MIDLKQPELIIFDFDGTLADTLDLFVKAFDVLAASHQFRLFDRGRLSHLRKLNAREILAHHGVPTWKLPKVTLEMRRLMSQDIDKVRLFPGVEQVLTGLRDRGAALGLLSSNSHTNAMRVLGLQTADIFSFIECGGSIFGKGAKLKRILRAAGVKASHAVLIGDEIRDCEAAKQTGMSFGAVAWGYNDPAALMDAGATFSFADVEELSRLRV